MQTILAVVIPVLRASLVAALAAGVLAAGGCSSPPRCPPGASCPPPPLPRVTFTPAMNGEPAVLRKDGHVPSYRVRPGGDLVMSVAVAVPQHLRLAALWLGISTGTWGNGPDGSPAGMRPVLVHFSRPLAAGVHTFGLRWHIPENRSGGLYLTMAWTSHQPSLSVSGPVARLILS